MNKEYQSLFKSLMRLRDYCYNHTCNSNCDFFLTGGGCELRSTKPPKFWHISDTIIKGMDCEELKPAIVKEEENDKSNREDDKSAEQEGDIP